MSLINLSLQHGTTEADAVKELADAVERIRTQFGALVRTVEWAEDRRAVRLTGPGGWVAVKVDASHVHCEGDVPLVSKLLAGPLKRGLEGVLKRSFPKALPEK